MAIYVCCPAKDLIDALTWANRLSGGRTCDGAAGFALVPRRVSRMRLRSRPCPTTPASAARVEQLGENAVAGDLAEEFAVLLHADRRVVPLRLFQDLLNGCVGRHR